MVDLFSRNRKHSSVIEVFDKMRKAGYFLDSNVIALVLNAYRKLQEFDKANDVCISRCMMKGVFSLMKFILRR
ncbi:putative tetratricopeptide-like helical domain superfamily [Helianthus anomalus]